MDTGRQTWLWLPAAMRVSGGGTACRAGRRHHRAIAYVTLLFAIASLGDRRAARRRPPSRGPTSMRSAWRSTARRGPSSARSAWRRSAGFEFLAIYIGPVLVFLFGYPLLAHRPARQAEKITSIADFLGARYGKSFAVASIATLIATSAPCPTSRCSSRRFPARSA
jgi:hypothetical protein